MADSEGLNRQVVLQHLGALTQMGAVAVVVLYVCGFLTISLHYARYGIVQFDLLRAKVLSAGILLSVFLAISAFQVFRMRSSVWIQSALGSPQHADVSFIRPLYLKTVLFFDLFFPAIFLGYFMSMLFREFKIDRWTIGFYVCFAAFAGASIIALRMALPRKVRTAALLCILTYALGTAGLVLTKDWPRLYLTLWFLMSAQMINVVVDHFNEPKKFREVELHKWILNIVALVGLFAWQIYPQIRPSLGGGAPTAVEMQFEQKSPIDGSQRSRVWLLDENDNGFYVVMSPSDVKAIFIPRRSISAVYFAQ